MHSVLFIEKVWKKAFYPLLSKHIFILVWRIRSIPSYSSVLIRYSSFDFLACLCCKLYALLWNTQGHQVCSAKISENPVPPRLLKKSWINYCQLDNNPHGSPHLYRNVLRLSFLLAVCVWVPRAAWGCFDNGRRNFKLFCPTLSWLNFKFGVAGTQLWQSCLAVFSVSLTELGGPSFEGSTISATWLNSSSKRFLHFECTRLCAGIKFLFLKLCFFFGAHRMCPECSNLPSGGGVTCSVAGIFFDNCEMTTFSKKQNSQVHSCLFSTKQQTPVQRSPLNAHQANTTLWLAYFFLLAIWLVGYCILTRENVVAMVYSFYSNQWEWSIYNRASKSRVTQRKGLRYAREFRQAL